MNNPNSKPRRVAAVDILRAITMTLMLFVNDFAGIPNIPHWLHHAKTTEDMMGFSDVVFPAFVFCMGMSVVLAIDVRYRKGDTSLQVIAHVFWRTVALLVMGLFTLNCYGDPVSLTPIEYNILRLLMKNLGRVYSTAQIYEQVTRKLAERADAFSTRAVRGL